jgi:AraC-like DNA-binding protein
MTHHSYIPSFPLNRFISGFTYYKGYTSDHTIDRYLPNGNIEIIINLTDTPKYIYDNNTLTEIQACKKVWISGIRSKFISIPSGTGSEMFIIEFKKGMVQSFLGRPLTEITEKVIEGDLVLNHIFLEMREQLLEKQSASAMFLTAEKMLTDGFHNKLATNPFVEFAVNSIIANPAQTTIKSIAHKTGYSSKHLIKIFSGHVGVNPKSFLRIIRFQKAIKEIETRGNINWISLADECGYYDQAHLIANFKEFSGFTPLQYVEKTTGEWLNYVPVA